MSQFLAWHNSGHLSRHRFHVMYLRGSVTVENTRRTGAQASCLQPHRVIMTEAVLNSKPILRPSHCASRLNLQLTRVSVSKMFIQNLT